ncbi:MAG TPA: hypothetical protein VFW33_22295 [Gemmataceae bacterium]|nr:hypothetical protein [Gemmataceae bacterium]
MSAIHQVRAPKEDGAVVAEPPLAEVGRLLADNRRILAADGPPLLGLPWSELRQLARKTLLTAARFYTTLTGIVPVRASDTVLMAGHQPELFHPGVWVKNFALNGLAREFGANPVNLVVDNDAVKGTSLHFPVVRPPLPSVRDFQAYRAAEPFDVPASGEPYEERAVKDEGLFASLPQRVRMGGDFDSLLPGFWHDAVRAAQFSNLLGERFAIARRRLESRWGCSNLEAPVCVICQTTPYERFACDLLTNLPRLHTAYNGSVHDYRARYGLRSTSHPVPDLATEGEWLEAPFWAWRAGQARRNRLMARLTPAAVDLRAGEESWPSLPREPDAMLRAFHDLGRQGLKVRSRALTNTLYARLFLCDLFIHGIGGGKYDEVTDAIIRRYYGAEPPAYLVLSATLLLPLPRHPAGDCRALHREARDLFYNPQRHLTGEARSRPEVAALAARKGALIREEPADRHGRRERFRQIREVTERLRGAAGQELEAARRAADGCDAAARADAILTRRDYPFVLYPEATLRPFCERFLNCPGTPPV